MPSLKYLVFRDIAQDHIADIFDEIYNKKIYRPYVIGKKDLVIADFGANQGVTVQYFAPYAKTLYAVEPSKIHLEALTRMIELNKLEQVIVCPYAISNKSGTEKFYHSPNPTAFSFTNFMPPDQTDFEEVKTVTIGEFFRENKLNYLDILKLDIEGAEAKLISSQEFISLAPRIKVILGEYHEWCGVSRDMFMNMLQDLGYEFHWRNDTKAACFEAQRI